MNQLRNLLRTLFGIRRTRAVPRASFKPGVGARIVCDEHRMIVQAGMSEPLWAWLSREGWREVTHRPDRRRYLDISHTFVTELIDASPQDWARILREAKSEATYRRQGRSRRVKSSASA